MSVSNAQIGSYPGRSGFIASPCDTRCLKENYCVLKVIAVTRVVYTPCRLINVKGSAGDKIIPGNDVIKSACYIRYAIEAMLANRLSVIRKVGCLVSHTHVDGHPDGGRFRTLASRAYINVIWRNERARHIRRS
jgi:hypothetical protein